MNAVVADAQAVAVEGRDLTKLFDSGDEQVRALDNVSVTIRENEFFTLLGPSGCGKTTLLRLIAGFEHPTAGEVLLHGDPIGHLPPYLRPVNTVFQSYALFPHMTVGENIAFGLQMLRKTKQEIDATVDEMLRLVQMERLRRGNGPSLGCKSGATVREGARRVDPMASTSPVVQRRWSFPHRVVPTSMARSCTA